MRKLLIALLTVIVALSAPVQPDDCEMAARNHPILRSSPNQLKGEVLRDEHFILYEYSPAGFVAVSRDTDIRPVIAWSFKSTLSGSELGIVDILRQDLFNRHQVLSRTPMKTIEENRTLWSQYLSSSILAFTDLTEYGPWTTTTWNQSEPYNNLCPTDPITGERCPTGCVITCVSQILNYWEYPIAFPLTEADSYTSESTDPPIEIDATTANMDTVCWNGDGIAEPDSIEIGRIMWAVGVSLGAGYADGGTVAHCDASILRSRFDYPMAEDWSVSRPGYRTHVQDNMIEGKIGYLSMSGADAGHAMVLDGWEESGAFHINMGWGGHEDAWYYVFDELPLDFTGITGMILDIVANFHWDIENSCSRAMEIIPRAEPQKKINAIMPETDVDWFRFNAIDDSSYSFWSTGPNDMYMEIYDACDGEMVFSLDDGGDGNNFYGIFSTERDAEGEYFVKVGAHEASMDVNYQFWYQRVPRPDRPFINLVNPAGGETLIGGETQSIFFTKGGTPPVARVRLEYSVSGTEGPWELIVDSLMTTFYTWHIPDFDEPLYDYRHCYIRLTDVAGAISTMNTTPLRIRDPEAITEARPLPVMSISTYPNPFNSAVNISYTGYVGQAAIYSTEGRQLSKLFQLDGTGSITWTPDNNTPTGVLLLKVHTSQNQETRKLLFIK